MELTIVPSSTREYKRIQVREWRKKNPERNKELHREASRRRKEKYPEIVREQNNKACEKYRLLNYEEIRERARKRYAEDGGRRQRLSELKYAKNNPIKLMLSRAKARAKRYGREFNLMPEDITVPSICPLLNIPISWDSHVLDNRPSLDRLDNSKGYIKGNIVVVSHRANRLKNVSDWKELMLLANNLKTLVEES